MNTKDLEKLIPESWDKLPDLDLYMDQVLSLIERTKLIEDGHTLTSSMVNNYAKQGLLPRAKGKRYTKEHLMLLTIISQLKQVYGVSELGQIMGSMRTGDVSEGYEIYRGHLIEALEALEAELGDPLRLAAFAFVFKIASEQLIEKSDD